MIKNGYIYEFKISSDSLTAKQDINLSVKMNAHQILSDLSDKIDKCISSMDLDQNNKNELKTKKDFVIHKLCAVRYHFNRLKKLEDGVIEEAGKKIREDKNIKISNGVTLKISDNHLLFELEAFLFQAKSLMERMCNTVAFLYKSKARGPESLLKVLKNFDTNESKKLQNVFYKNLSWIRVLTENRVQVTHFGTLKEFPFKISFKDRTKKEISFSGFSHKTCTVFVVPYCFGQFTNLVNIFRDIFSIIFNINLNIPCNKIIDEISIFAKIEQ